MQIKKKDESGLYSYASWLPCGPLSRACALAEKERARESEDNVSYFLSSFSPCFIFLSDPSFHNRLIIFLLSCFSFH